MTRFGKFVVVIWLISIILVCMAFHYIGYKQGQIDYANGKVLYILQYNQDKELNWEKK